MMTSLNTKAMVLGAALLAAAPLGCGRAFLTVDAVSGQFNLAFGVNGLGTVDFGTASQVYRATTVPSDKLLLVGSNVNGANLNLALARLTSTGALDTTYGTAGKVTTLFANGGTDQLNQVIFDASSNAIAIGRVNSRFAIGRYSSAGVIDPTFNGGAVQTTVVAGAVDTAAGVAVQSDGKIVVVGTANSAGGNPNSGIVRYTTAGVVDFNTSLDYGLLKPDGANAVAIHTDGAIVVAGYTATLVTGDKEFAIARYGTTGLLDVAFNLVGYVTLHLSAQDDVANAVAVQPDGKILAAGYTTISGAKRAAVVRLTTTGALDPTFGTAGVALVDVVFGQDEEALTINYTSSGILIGGYAYTGTHDEMFVARLTTGGILDGTFGSGGILQYASSTTASRTMGLLTSGSDIYAMGYGFTGLYNLFAILQITL